MGIWSAANRREFLKFLAASPLLGALGQVPRSDDVIASPRTRSTSSTSRSPLARSCHPRTTGTWQPASTTTRRCAPIGRDSPTIRCDPAG